MRYIKYIGLAHIRQVTAADWRSVGISGDTVVWSARNGFAIPADSLTDDQIRKAIEPDRDFVITGADEDFTPQPQTTDMSPAQLEQNIENPVDVATMLDGDSNVSEDDSEGLDEAPGGRAPGESTDQPNASIR
jgi:hypothetical protein